MKSNRPMLFILVWTLAGLCYAPVFIAAWFLHIVARLLLSIAYFGMLNGQRGRDVFKSLFSNERIEFKDVCVTKAAEKGELYLDMNEDLPDVTEYEKELKESMYAISLLGGKFIKVESFIIPETDIRRSFIIIQKEKQTPSKFPRKAGKPAKSPLKAE